MARREKDAQDFAAEPLEFFPHDSSAAEDPKCKRLIKRLGFEGYGRWWKLCEMIAAEHYHLLNVSSRDELEYLSDELQCSTAECKAFLDTLAQLDLINAELWESENHVISERMSKNAAYSGKLRKQRTDAINARWRRAKASVESSV